MGRTVSMTPGKQPNGGYTSGDNDRPCMCFGDFEDQSDDSDHDQHFTYWAQSHFGGVVCGVSNLVTPCAAGMAVTGRAETAPSAVPESRG